VTFKDQIQNPRKLHALKIREELEGHIREFFRSAGFRETRTPLLVSSPGIEIHLNPVQVVSKKSTFLPSSPEFAMKKLLVGGLKNIFQICPAFRSEPVSDTHLPEFTMLEWYRSNAKYEDIMKDVEGLFSSFEKKFPCSEISFKTPWPRLTISDLFKKFSEIDLGNSLSVESLRPQVEALGLISKNAPSENWDDLFHRVWLNKIETNLPKNQAVIVKDYPPQLAALSEVTPDPNGNLWARRFEVYAGGYEIANAFQELTDPNEQEKRFKEELSTRRSIYKDRYPDIPIDEEFIEALKEGMPPCSGIALGVDRMVMLFAGEKDIRNTVWLPSHYE